MIYDAGTLNKRIDIIKPQSQDTDGWDKVADNAIYKRIAASIKPARGREFYESQRLRDDAAVKITIRYRKNIDEGCKVKYKDHMYDIQSVVDPEMMHESLEFYCIEKKRGDSNG